MKSLETTNYDTGNGLLVIWTILYHIFQNSKTIDDFTKYIIQHFYAFFLLQGRYFWEKESISEVIKKRFLITYITFLIIGYLQ